METALSVARGLLVLVASLLAVSCAAVPDPGPAEALAAARAAGPGGPRPWVELDAPVDGAEVRALMPWVEVQGRAGLGTIHHYDVVLAIDVSRSVLDPSGADVDGDGVVGEKQIVPPWVGWDEIRVWTTDWDDTTFRAEIRAAELLVDRLVDTTRVGIVTFGNQASEQTGLTTAERARSKLGRIRDPKPNAGTALSRGIDAAVRVLNDGPSVAGRERVILLISDGMPTLPEPWDNAERAALDAAEVAADQGIRIHAIALGDEAIRRTNVFERVAVGTRGQYVPLENPGDLPTILPHLSLGGLDAVEVRNRTAGTSSEAVRVFPDGAFDAFVKLMPGANVLEIEAELVDGRRATATRTVVYHQPQTPNESDREAAEDLRENVRLRTMEMNLAAEARAHRAAQRRELTVRPEAD